MIRFILLWGILASGVYVYRYIFTKGDRKSTKTHLKNITISMVISGVVIAVLYLINNLQGI